MSLEHMQTLPSTYVPNSRIRVIAPGDQDPIVGLQTADCCRMASQGQLGLVGFRTQVPDADGSVSAAGDEGGFV